MEKINLTILSKDEEYREVLVQYMKVYCVNYVIKVLDLKKKENNVLSEIEDSSDILLIESEFFNQIKKEVSKESGKKTSQKLKTLASKTIFLKNTSDQLENHGDNSDNREITSEFTVIPKYGDMSKLVSIIDNKYYGNNPSAVKINSLETKVIMCIGLSGGSGVSTIAESLAARLSKDRDSRVFYFSLDTFESGFDSENDKTQENITYSIIKNNFIHEDGIVENGMIETADKVWRLPPAKHINTLNELNKDEKKLFIKELLHKKHFDYFVIDGSNHVNELTDYLISNANDVIIIDRHKSNKSHYAKNYINYVEETMSENKNSIFVENYCNEGAQTYNAAISIKNYSNDCRTTVKNKVEFNVEIEKILGFIG